MIALAPAELLGTVSFIRHTRPRLPADALVKHASVLAACMKTYRKVLVDEAAVAEVGAAIGVPAPDLKAIVQSVANFIELSDRD